MPDNLMASVPLLCFTFFTYQARICALNHNSLDLQEVYL